MKTIEEVRDRCRVDEITGCWVWTGAMSGGIPRIYAPDLLATERRLDAALQEAFAMKRPTARIKVAILQAMDPIMESQAGRRAVWQMAKGRGVQDGYQVFNTCLNELCVNPAHMRCGTGLEVGRFTAKVGRYKGQPARMLANRRIARKRTSVTPEHAREFLLSPETGLEIAARLGYSRTIVSKYRAGHATAHSTIGSLFPGLGA